MSITKIQKVKSLKAVINYSKQDHKTREDLMTTYSCNLDTIERDFQSVLNEYNKKNNKSKDLPARMIIQSFNDDNLTPEVVHQMGIDLAENYLKGNHQYAVITHIETENLHNHIIFNDINFNDLKLFESKRFNTLHKLREENDKITEKNGLKTIEKGTKNRNKSISFNEYVVRAIGTSFKEKLEIAIDKNIEKAIDYEDFLKLMDQDGFKSKEGKYLSFENAASKKNMRTKTLGFNYYKESIKYRIDHKEYVPSKIKTINKKWIDRTEEKFKNNKALNSWATKQNIQYLNEINKAMYQSGNTKNEILEERKSVDEFIKTIESKLMKLDNEIHRLQGMDQSFEVYKNSYNLMVGYKKLDNADKPAYKKANYLAFKEYDIAKKDLNYLKKNYNISDSESLEFKILDLQRERKEVYKALGKDIERDEQQKKKRDFER